MLGYRGDGIIIAIIDSGVDNEHRSLNDFDDINDDPDADATSYSDAKYLGGFQNDKEMTQNFLVGFSSNDQKKFQ